MKNEIKDFAIRNKFDPQLFKEVMRGINIPFACMMHRKKRYDFRTKNGKGKQRIYDAICDNLYKNQSFRSKIKQRNANKTTETTAVELYKHYLWAAEDVLHVEENRIIRRGSNLYASTIGNFNVWNAICKKAYKKITKVTK